MIANFQASGLSKSAYCRQEGIPLTTFAGWEKEIKKRDAEVADEQQKRTARRGGRKRNRGGNARQLREQFWQKAVARFVTSGLSEEAFCTQEDFFPPTFAYWKSQVLQNIEAKEATEQHQTFVPLIVAEQAPRAAEERRNSVAEIVFSRGSVLLFGGIDLETAITLLRAVTEVRE